MSEPLVFLATIPPIQTAIKVAGDGGARVQIDIPESEAEAIKAILDLRGGELIITVQRRPAQQEAAEPTPIKRWNERRT